MLWRLAMRIEFLTIRLPWLIVLFVLALSAGRVQAANVLLTPAVAAQISIDVLDTNANFYATFAELINQYGDDKPTLDQKVDVERTLLRDSLSVLYANNNTTALTYTQYCSKNSAAIEKFMTDNPAFKTTLEEAKAELVNFQNQVEVLLEQKGLK